MKQLLLAVLFLFLISCDGNESSIYDDDETFMDEDSLVDDDVSEWVNDRYFDQKVTWFDCKLDEMYLSGEMGKCADFKVPMNWNDEKSISITLRIKKNLVDNPNYQLFMLQGGPGGSSTIYFGVSEVPIISKLDSSIETIMMDQRGTGFSEFLDCSALSDSRLNPEEVDKCIEELEFQGYDLAFFNTEQSAKDLEFIRIMLKKESIPQYIYGVSYGTTLAHEHARAFPDSAQGYILAGLNFEGTMSLSAYDKKMNNLVLALFERCNNDETCSGKIKENVVDFAKKTADAVKNQNLCKESFLQTPLQGYTSYLPYIGHEIATRIPDIFPALYFRLARCEEKDIAVIRKLINTLYGGSSDVDPEISKRYFNYIISNNIKVSELLGEDELPSITSLTEEWNNSLASGMQDLNVVKIADVWPKYSKSQYWGKWASKNIPILMVAGTLDFQTQITDTRIFKDNLNGENQYFIEIPDGGHGLSKTAVLTNGSVACGYQLMVDFIHNPLSEPDKSCVSDVVPLNFIRNDAYTNYYFGVKDIWED